MLLPIYFLRAASVPEHQQHLTPTAAVPFCNRSWVYFAAFPTFIYSPQEDEVGTQCLLRGLGLSSIRPHPRSSERLPEITTSVITWVSLTLLSSCLPRKNNIFIFIQLHLTIKNCTHLRCKFWQFDLNIYYEIITFKWISISISGVCVW